MQGFQTHTAIQPISIQLLQTQQKPRVTEGRHNAEKHYFFVLDNRPLIHSSFPHIEQSCQFNIILTLKGSKNLPPLGVELTVAGVLVLDSTY